VAVYVDNMYASYGRMKMCHMIADTEEELHAMADKIGMKRAWFQRKETSLDHYDVGKGKRTLAVQHGAIEITTRQIGHHLLEKHKAEKDGRRYTGKPTDY